MLSQTHMNGMKMVNCQLKLGVLIICVSFNIFSTYQSIMHCHGHSCFNIP